MPEKPPAKIMVMHLSGPIEVDRADVEAFLNPRIMISKKCEERVRTFLRMLLR